MNWIMKALGSGDAAEAKKLIEQGSTVVDVRTVGEFQSGHLEGSVNIPLDKVASQLNKFKKMKQPIVTVCRSGNRSGSAARILNDAGIEAINGGPWVGLR
jgi:phage shock protein E